MALMMSLRFAPPASVAAPPPRRPRAVASSASSPALQRRRPQNVPGDFFVDHRCIDCQTCRWMASEVFKRVDGKAAVAAQPISDEHRTKALQGVYLCGYHSQDSYGATSYLLTHPDGNILVDSPRYTTKLAENIEKLGGARYMFLTHMDDVADHRKWAERLKCERIIHSGDVEDVTADVEWKLTGNGPWDIGADFELIHTPGHTEGSVCLFYKPVKALFTGDHVAKSEESDDLDLFLMYSKQSVGLQLDSMRKLLKLDFEWFLPGHGYRIHYKDVRAKDSAIESLIANYTS
ncbi:hypothetical protein OsJ_08980 [Oryza sativa Japonica Group]|uniref:Metallo-beta-lactamase domain-containing protein n=1 Tax=Oryza sativa subsp. japonica TaxID=39947 RepID=B9F4N6_ORYSJ|nr:hypothetical protein OsJ_08980 [Oryza sativa Japonica Group]